MRDLLFTLMFGCAAVPALTRAWLGVLIWTCLDDMNPHRFCYSYACYTIPFSLIAAVITVISIVSSSEHLRFTWSREVILLILFIVWMTITSLFALNDAVWIEWDRAIKVQMLVFATLAAMRTPERIHLLTWMTVVSIGIYGVKGGIWSIMTGGVSRVRGPQFTFIEDNNDIALALVVVLPFMRYLQLRTKNSLVRMGLGVAQALTALSVIGSYSRAGMIALGAVILLLVMKSRKKVVFGTFLAASIAAILLFMPQQWFDRMHTIETYKDDNSALGRLNAWGFAWNLAKDRPITGGGYRCFTPKFFRMYAPDPDNYHEAHSIFLKILAEHGFPGLFLFLALGFCAWRSASWVRRYARSSEWIWASDWASMFQVSLAGYAVGGAFSNLAYFGLPYHLMIMMVLCKATLHDAIAEGQDVTNSEPQESIEAVPSLAAAV